MFRCTLTALKSIIKYIFDGTYMSQSVPNVIYHVRDGRFSKFEFRIFLNPNKWYYFCESLSWLSVRDTACNTDWFWLGHQGEQVLKLGPKSWPLQPILEYEVCWARFKLAVASVHDRLWIYNLKISIRSLSIQPGETRQKVHFVCIYAAFPRDHSKIS